jgi:hypothetical protein
VGQLSLRTLGQFSFRANTGTLLVGDGGVYDNVMGYVLEEHLGNARWQNGARSASAKVIMMPHRANALSLAVGDEIYTVDGHPFQTLQQLVIYASSRPSGSPQLAFNYNRPSQNQNGQVGLGDALAATVILGGMLCAATDCLGMNLNPSQQGTRAKSNENRETDEDNKDGDSSQSKPDSSLGCAWGNREDGTAVGCMH